MLEANEKEDNCFVTLTYSDENLPGGVDGATLQPKDLQDWLKRFRSAIQPTKVRYFAVGEYGDRTWRPHYHLALFGWPQCRYGFSRYTDRRKDCCSCCDVIRETWGLGHIAVGSLETSSAQYIAGYVTKKMTFNDDPRLKGRHPEFARMSRNPAIGKERYRKYKTDVFPSDEVIARGHPSQPPPYYTKLLKAENEEAHNDIKQRRIANAKQHLENNTSARLRVREKIAAAKLKIKGKKL